MSTYSSAVVGTVTSGTLVASLAYLLKQFLDFYFFDRWKEFQALRGRAVESAIFLSHFLETLTHNAKDEVISTWINETQNVRRLAGAMVTFAGRRHRLLWGTPGRTQIRTATLALLGLSQCTRLTDYDKAKQYTANLLKALGEGTGIPGP